MSNTLNRCKIEYWAARTPHHKGGFVPRICESINGYVDPANASEVGMSYDAALARARDMAFSRSRQYNVFVTGAVEVVGR